MKIYSFCNDNKELIPVEIEVSLLPGLPQIHILGLADRNIKESILKIKSAIKTQGFELPKAKQIIVNLRPNDLQKKSSGLDLAISIAILEKVKQINIPIDSLFAYGEINLKGEIFQPKDIWKIANIHENVLLTGQQNNILRASNIIYLKTLLDLKQIKQNSFDNDFIDNQEIAPLFPSYNQIHQNQKNGTNEISFSADVDEIKYYENLLFRSEDAFLLKLLAIGNHSCLFMGPRGLGKTTLAQFLRILIDTPTQEIFYHYKKYFPVKESSFWRPFVQPHHSISHLALVGGGPNCQPGELTRAHGGVLFLDELLEFNPKCQEALREPLESKEINLTRGQQFQKYPCDFQLLATTNLCPCGQWLPAKEIDCHMSQSKCQKYREKLSGPLLDRFEILYFVKEKINSKKPLLENKSQIKGQQIISEIQEIRERKTQLESTLSNDSLLETNYLLNSLTGSLRRKKAAISIAKTIALIKNHTHIQESDIIEALDYTWTPFLELKF